MRRLRASAARRLLAVIVSMPSLLACDDLTGGDSDDRWITGYFSGPVPALNTTSPEPVLFFVMEGQDPAADVELTFSVRGDASVDPMKARTNENGAAATRLTLGETPARVYITGRIAGSSDSAMVSVVPVRRTLVLTPDTIRITGEGCGWVATARIGPAATFTLDPDDVDPGIRFELSDSSVARLAGLSGTDYRRPKRLVIGTRVGRTELIASFAGAVPDTSLVEVFAPNAADTGC